MAKECMIRYLKQISNYVYRQIYFLKSYKRFEFLNVIDKGEKDKKWGAKEKKIYTILKI